MILGATLLGRAAARSGLAPVWAGRLFAGAVPAFTVAGSTFDVLQPVAGLAVAVSGLVLARVLSDARPVEPDQRRSCRAMSSSSATRPRSPTEPSTSWLSR